VGAYTINYNCKQNAEIFCRVDKCSAMHTDVRMPREDRTSVAASTKMNGNGGSAMLTPPYTRLAFQGYGDLTGH